jgi:hypothetical protein
VSHYIHLSVQFIKISNAATDKLLLHITIIIVVVVVVVVVVVNIITITTIIDGWTSAAFSVS